MGNVPQQFEAKSPAPTLPPVAPMPSPNQEMPSKNSHILGIILVSVAILFVVCALLWLIFGHSVKSQPATTAVSPTPLSAVSSTPPSAVSSTSPSTSTPSHAPTVYPVNAPPPPTAAEFASLSKGLRSGNSFEFAGVTALNPKTIPESTLEKYAKMQAIVFDEKSFKVKPDGKTATVQVTITLESGEKSQETYSFTAKYGKWVIDIVN